MFLLFLRHLYYFNMICLDGALLESTENVENDDTAKRTPTVGNVVAGTLGQHSDKWVKIALNRPQTK